MFLKSFSIFKIGIGFITKPCSLVIHKSLGYIKSHWLIDGLGPKSFKLAINSLSPIIAILINKSIHTGQFPNEMKCAKVFPIFKGGNKSDPSNYRPISILSTISKNI